MSQFPISALEKPIAFSRRLFLGSSLAAAVLPSVAKADEAAPSSAATGLAPRLIPARELPVPKTVSPELQAVIGAPYPLGWNDVPQDSTGWKDLAFKSAASVANSITAIRDHFSLKVEQTTMAGVPVFVITPEEIAPNNRDRLLVHIHGGGYVLFPGEAGAGEGMMMAGYGKFRVVSIDYRMAPDFPFPAALDDVTAVWRVLLASYEPSKMGIFGTSAGGALTLSTILRAKSEGLPLPGAIAPASPCADLTWSGDSVMANAYVDNALVSRSGWVGAAAALYAGTHDLTDPELSPLFGDFSGFPPAILTSGTRDLILSDTVRTHRKLRQARVNAVLQIFEGESHAQFLTPFVPETQESFGEIAHFFDAHLAS
ncbi:alpha/beta hydrolase [Hyphomicrobium sp.]|jgi:acetyl esterase/lipase|uniref:alpha/beta hydrolase n=1 Tax=Hyphomicrobium sp. TaxID=82 RepID=UPI00356A3DAE